MTTDNSNNNSSSKKILLVEDNPISSKIQSKMLESRGYHVDLVSNGHDAFLQVQKEAYALVLMDINMPVLNGYEAAAMINKWEMKNRDTETKIVALTAHDLPEKDAKQNTGINFYLKKPLSDESLNQILNEI